MVATVRVHVGAFLDIPNCREAGDPNSNHATLLFYNAFIQKDLHKPAYSVSEVDHTILLVLMQVPKWFHNLLVRVGKCFDFSPKIWVSPFYSHKH
jgi:hypothetical protein